jgi:hypothetical protein
LVILLIKFRKNIEKNKIEETSLWSKLNNKMNEKKIDKLKLEELFKIEEKKSEIKIVIKNNIIDFKRTRNIEILLSSQFKNIENDIPNIINNLEFEKIDSTKSIGKKIYN